MLLQYVEQVFCIRNIVVLDAEIVNDKAEFDVSRLMLP